MSSSGSVPFDAPAAEYERAADDLLDALLARDEQALWRIKWEHPRFRDRQLNEVLAATLGPDDSRRVVAREHGFEDWADLVGFTQVVNRDESVRRFELAVDAVVSGDIESLRTLLAEDPGLVLARSARRHHATLLHYIGANGVEGGRQKTPANVLAIAKLLLDEGSEVDAVADMYDEKCTTMSMLVSSSHPAAAGVQAELAELLIDHGAAIEGAGTRWHSALYTALTFGFLDTARALARRGAPSSDLPTHAGLGHVEESARLLPESDAGSRHMALALASQHGHVDIVRLLLDVGEDPNRLNPEGHHSHSTPLHQAVASDHLNVVRLLVERGARLDIRDSIYDGTPLGWAEYLERREIAQYLREAGARS